MLTFKTRDSGHKANDDYVEDKPKKQWRKFLIKKMLGIKLEKKKQQKKIKVNSDKLINLVTMGIGFG